MVLSQSSGSVLHTTIELFLPLVQILHLSLTYFVLCLTSGIFVSYLRTSQLTPVSYLLNPSNDILLYAFHFVLVTLWARFVIVDAEVPRLAKWRLAFGSVAAIMTTVVEVGRAVVAHEPALDLTSDGRAIGAGAMVLFTLMPWLLMVLTEGDTGVGETRESLADVHQRERKNFRDAIFPTSKNCKHMRIIVDGFVWNFTGIQGDCIGAWADGCIHDVGKHSRRCTQNIAI